MGNSKKKGCQAQGRGINTVSRRAEVAQSVEQGTENPRVGSSILSLGTIEIKGLAAKLALFSFDSVLLPNPIRRCGPRAKGFGENAPCLAVALPARSIVANAGRAAAQMPSRVGMTRPDGFNPSPEK